MPSRLPESAYSALRTGALTAVAMIAFAANSLLCRMALGAGAIDPASFAAIRTLAGAVLLACILGVRGEMDLALHISWRPAALLFVYMICFSFAYLSLSAGAGALILFGAVQMTMFLTALRNGEHFSMVSWIGLATAGIGFIYLVSPGVAAPDPFGAMLMAAAGVAWGAYSLLGRTAVSPIVSTGGAFILALPGVLSIALVASLARVAHATDAGVVLAVASGAVASGAGYVIWYAALGGLTATRASTVQLSVPVIAAFGGVFLLGEAITVHLILASAATLGGVAVVLLQRTARPDGSTQQADRP